MIKLIRSTFYDEQRTRRALADFILDADKLSMGEQCLAFEKAFAAKQQRNYATFLSSGSAANLVLIQSYLNIGRLKKGDRIGVSALTWATNIMPLFQLGLEPVLLDASLDTLNVTPGAVQSVVHDLDGLFLTNVLGFCDHINQLSEICRDEGILFFEDNCESLGSRAYGRLLGNFGNASTFSFFVGHHLSTIEGGMICTDDEELHEMVMLVRAHGWDRSLPREKRHALRSGQHVDEFYARYTFYDLAYNCRPTEVSGFLGNIQLSFWDAIVAARAQNFEVFSEAIARNGELLALDVSHMDLVSNFAIPVICRSTAGFHTYHERFESGAVETRPIIAGDMSRQPFFAKHAREPAASCVNSRFVHDNGFYFGNSPDITADERAMLCELLHP